MGYVGVRLCRYLVQPNSPDTSNKRDLAANRLYLCHAMCLKRALFEKTKSGIIQLKAICVASVVVGVKILGCFFVALIRGVNSQLCHTTGDIIKGLGYDFEVPVLPSQRFCRDVYPVYTESLFLLTAIVTFTLLITCSVP